MKPDLLDREIEALLGVDPPSDFESRVRMRIARAPVPSVGRFVMMRFGWSMVAASAMAAAIVVAFVITGPHVLAPPESSGPAASTSMLANAPEVELPASVPSRVHAVHVPGMSRSEIREPEMLISPREAAAMKRLLNSPPVRWIEIPEVDIDPQPLPELVITPIPMSPMSPMSDSTAVSKGDPQ
jgi:hypothetical protein